MIDRLTSARQSPFWQLITRFDASRLSPAIAARNTLGVLLALGAGVALGSRLGGVAAASGALMVSYRDTGDSYRRRALGMLVTTAAMAMAILIGGLTGRHPLLAVVVSAAAAFSAGMAVALGPLLADIAVIAVVLLITYSAQPLTMTAAFGAGALAFAGGLLQTALSLALWPVRHDLPERRVLGALYIELARLATQPVMAVESPPATLAVNNAQQMLRGAPEEDRRTERHRSLLVQAERMRLSILMLRRLHRRLEQNESRPALEPLDEFLDGTRLVLGAIAEALFTGNPPDWLPARLADLQRLADAWRAAHAGSSTRSVQVLAGDVRSQMDALSGQMRSAADLARSDTTTDPVPPPSGAPRRRLSPLGALATLRANLDLESATFRHALRLAVCVALGEILAHAIQWRRAYWIPMTIVIVLKPDFAATFSRGVLRIAGTLVGLLVATLLFHVFPASVTVQAGLLAVFVFVLRWAGGANYGVFTIAVSAVIVLLLALTGVAPAETIVARGLDTAAGGALALAAYALWPTWERHRVGDALAVMLDAYEKYFRSVLRRRGGSDSALEAEGDQLRLAARLARTNVEASLERLRAEPGLPDRRIDLLQRIMASSHRFAHAVMALEVAPQGEGDAGDGAAFAHFADEVVATLAALTTAVRDDQALVRHALPDLPEAVHALVAADGAGGRPVGLVHVEADRIANSLDTLTDQVIVWRSTPDGA